VAVARIVHRDKELQEKLGRKDPCPCGSGRHFQQLLHARRRFDGSPRAYYFQGVSAAAQRRGTAGTPLLRSSQRPTWARPCAKTIERRWGWRELLAEAVGVRPGLVNVSWDAILDDRDQAMLAELRAARDELGRWPTAAEWDRSRLRPSARAFVRHFGSWAQAWRAASRSGIGSLPGRNA
jgi:hypothetical protein